jgi:GT2 family glycosyltransferase/SAM-dependent methyltransferase/glycosyltransferase involved in cell wall biosynthesis
MIGGVSFRRRAAAPRLIEWTGERCVPWAPDVQVVYEHFHRYLWARELIGGRRVLDLGSGEGFGAALLAEQATHVVGIDVDEKTVEHSTLNYAGENLEFRLGTAVDLSAFEDGSFDAVVAFEIIEHVREQERVIDEVSRVLSDDGLLVISTPDRRAYGEARREPNPFHARELTLEEFVDLLGTRFAHTAAWGQRTITGSHLNPLGEQLGERAAAASEFFLERFGDEWRVAAGPPALYCMALASRAPLSGVPASSTLADCGIELVRDKERDTARAIGERERAREEKQEYVEALERERVHHNRLASERDEAEQRRVEQLRHRIEAQDQELAGSERMLLSTRNAAEAMRAEIIAGQQQLAAERQVGRRVAESVSWQIFQKLRGRLYRGLGGERSRRARALGAALRIGGRRIGVGRSARVAPPGPESPPAPAPVETIELPEYDRPLVSLVIPLYSRADLTGACLRSIRDNTSRVAYEVVLIDDQADAETKRLLEGVRGAKIIRNEQNIGYLRSINRAAGAARGSWLVLFNNDTEVTPGWLRAMVDCAESAPDIGVVTPKFVYPDGRLNEAGAVIWRDGTGVNYGRGDRPDRFRYEYRRETDYGSAAALLVSARLWHDAGGFDERFLPMFYEDVDLCFQARERGLRVVYEPTAVVVHVEGATTGNDVTTGHKRFQEENRPKFVAKWRERLEREHEPPSAGNLPLAVDRHHGPEVLVVDHRVPMWDRDAGSLRILKIIEALIGLGARVTLMPENFTPIEPYTRQLQNMGVKVLYGELDPRAELASLGARLDTAILCRPHPTSHWLDTVRELAPQATVVYDTVDLHWLREARRSELAAPSAPGLPLANEASDRFLAALPPKAMALRELELAMMRATDVTIVVSAAEREQVLRDVPGASVLVVPTLHEVAAYVAPPSERAGVLFVGGFEHIPNVDAAIRLVDEVMPRVWAELGDVEVTIVGSQPPPDVLALATPLVDVAGWVEDLEPLLMRSRLMVAPLRFGAGVKGKITQCLAAGLPVVTTSLGAEGLDVEDGESILIADEPAEIAERIIRGYRDVELWERISASGQAVIAANCSPEAIESQMRQLLGEVATAEQALALETSPSAQ